MSTTSTTTSNTADPAAPTDPAPVRSPLVGWLAVVTVMMGIFAIVTTEILPIGVLTAVGASFRISDGVAGLMMTMPGVLAAIAAPTVTVATARLDRRLMLCLLMLVLTLANILAAVATAYWVMMISRVLVGFVIGAFWSIGAGLGARLVRPERAGLATAVIFSAVPLGSVLGVPAGTLIGNIADWRAAFVALAIVSAAVFVSLIVFVPPLPPVRVTRLSVLRGMLRSTAVRVGLAATFLIVLAHFGTYTYVTPFLETVTGIAPGGITVCLLIYGAAGVAGNFVAGALVSRNLRVVFGASACLLAGATLLLPVLGRSVPGAVVLLVVWGTAYGAVPVCSQSWFAASAPHAPEAATVVFTASFQATIAVGALVGGVVVDATSPSVVMVLGGTVAILMVATVCLADVDGTVRAR
ncbi:MFS transporter [Phytoactinopolyspora endophytica]|uniref:MFS transporter n=1 Tax=Phytoactinopolyspora endophytica TaxID=1642495 RepID=UPI00101C098D|nr:MFS transporter [Phytoactinopolyspora endophytica]